MIFKAYNFVIDSDIDLDLPKPTNQTPDIYFRKKERIEPANKLTKIYRKGIQAKVEINQQSVILDWEGIARFEIYDGKYIDYQLFTQEMGVFRLFALSEALGIVLFQKGIFLLHGSAVQIQQKATIFIGLAGAGKSTTVAAFAKEGFTVLSDDMVAITFDDNQKLVALPSFPQIKIWEDAVENLGFDNSPLKPAFEGKKKFIFNQNQEVFPQVGIPIEKIIVLQKPYSKKHKEIKPAEASIELLKFFPLAHQLLKGFSLQKHFMDSLKIASEVKIVRMNRPKNFIKLQEFIAQYK